MARRYKLPKDAVIDRIMATINGSSDAGRVGYLDRQRAGSTIDLFKAAFSNPLDPENLGDTLQKSVTIATGLTYFDLRAPALNLFPTVTPLRNSIPRNQRENPGDALHYKAVLATVGSGFPYMGWVPEGKRSASMSYQTTNVTLPYVSLGEEDSLTDEARFAAAGFEDEDALVQLRLLLKMFVKEEAAILGGNATLQLGVPANPVLGTSGTVATLPTGTYSVKVVALTQEGFLNSSLLGGVATTLNITGNDSNAYTLNGGSSNISAGTVTQAITAGQALTGTVTAIPGAVAYAWYASTTVGQERLQAITTINSVSLSAPLSSTSQLASAVTADSSANSGLAFDGLMTTAFKQSTSNSYVVLQPTGTAGTGTFLTPSGAGGVVEIDTMLVTLWNNFKISPTVLYVNAQELKNITIKVLTNASAPLLRYNSQVDDTGTSEYRLTAAGVIAFYFNPYTADGGIKIPVKIHPNMAPGTIVAYAEHLPPWYVSNQTPEVAMVQTRQDYYAEVWPKTTRTQFYGIYAQEALAVYAPFATAIIGNIGNG